MANLNDICKAITEEVDHALAAAVVDLESGLLLGVAHHVTYFNQSFLDSIAAASVEIFRGTGVKTVESLISQLRNEEPRSHIEDLHFSTDKTHHFMTVVPNKPSALAILVTRKKVRLGMGWTSLQNKLAEIADACP